MLIKKIVFLCSSLILLLSFVYTAYGVIVDDGPYGENPSVPGKAATKTTQPAKPDIARKEDQPLKYVPDEVLVKFKEGTDPLAALKGTNVEVKNAERIYSIKSAVTKFKKNYRLKKDKNGWYWFRGNKYKDIANISDGELFKEAYVQMIPEEKSLYRSYKITLPEGMSVEEAVNKLEKSPKVDYAEPNYIAEIQILPNDIYYTSSGSWGQSYDDLWGHKKIQCEKAWDLSQGEGVVVAVIDTGIDYDHPDLSENIWVNENEIPENNIDDDGNGYVDDVYGYDFIYDDSDPMDVYGHGSHTAGTIAAAGNNNIGVIGVAPQAKLMALKGLSDSGSGPFNKIALAIQYAADNGAQVLNNSYGGTGYSQLLNEVFNYAHSRGCVSIAAAGNDNANVAFKTPANIDVVIAVAASNQNDEKCSFSNYGDLIDLSAPGGGIENELGGGNRDRCNILSTMPDDCVLAEYSELKVSNGYYRLAGTSMACPHVAGVAALLVSLNPLAPPEEIRNMLRMSADDIGEPGKDSYFGFGRLNAYRASTSMGRISLLIDAPVHKAFIKGNIDIMGSAYAEYGFEEYKLFYASKEESTNTTLINSSNIPVENNFLGTCDTEQLDDGEYIISLILYTKEIGEYDNMVCVNVNNVSQPPTFVNLTDKYAQLGQVLEFKVEALDPDDPATSWGQLSYSAKGLPKTATFNPETQIFSWLPSAQDNETYDVTFTVNDNEHTINETITLSLAYVYIKEIPVCTENYNQNWPDIHENMVVWQDHRGAPQKLYADIYLYDLHREEEVQITNDPAAQSQPRIYDDNIVWWDTRQGLGNAHLYMRTYDSSTGELGLETQITDTPFHADGGQVVHTVYEGKILWASSFPDYDLFMYDILKKLKIKINNESRCTGASPDMYGNKIVWRGTDNYIYMRTYNSKTGELGPEECIIDRKCLYVKPDMYEDIIVYHSNDNEESVFYIYLYDMSRDEEIQVSNTVSGNPVIYGDRIVWTDGRDYYNSQETGNNDIYMRRYDHSTGLLGPEIQITNNIEHQGTPSIYKNMIVWQDMRTGDFINYDIYGAKVFFIPHIDFVSSSEVYLESLITISGNNFGYSKQDVGVILSNGTVLPVVEQQTNTEITCQIPQDAQTGSFELKVINAAGESNGIYVTISSLPNYSEILHNIEVAVRKYAFNFLDKMLYPERYDANFDLNNDGWVTVTDELLVRNIHLLPKEVFTVVYNKLMAAVRERLGLTSHDDDFIVAFDVNTDGLIDQNDYEIIHNVLMGK